jgi:hypothetical protein
MMRLAGLRWQGEGSAGQPTFGAGRMSIDFYLYRAPKGVGGLHEWEEDHAEPLGPADGLLLQVAALFPDVTWGADAEGSLYGASANDDGPQSVRFLGMEDDTVQFLVVYAGPAVWGSLMTELGLNYCYVPEACELRDPFAVGEDWARH